MNENSIRFCDKENRGKQKIKIMKTKAQIIKRMVHLVLARFLQLCPADGIFDCSMPASIVPGMKKLRKLRYFNFSFKNLFQTAFEVSYQL